MNVNTKQLLFGIGKGEKRAIGRALSLLENNGTDCQYLLSALSPFAGNSFILGIIGAPGTGKSFLTGKLLKEIRKVGLTIGILAVEPSDSLVGSANLGERLMLQTHMLDHDIFIHTLKFSDDPVKGALDIQSAVKVLDAAGKDVIIIETVCTERRLPDIMSIADTVLVVLTPDTKDNILVRESGFIDKGDIFVVNKGDLEGALEVKKSIELLLKRKRSSSWMPPVMCASSLNDNGFTELWQSIYGHWQYLAANNILAENRVGRRGKELAAILQTSFRIEIGELLINEAAQDILEMVLDNSLDPYTAAQRLAVINLDQ